MGTFIRWAKQLSVLTGMTVGVVVGLIYQPSWWVISLVSLLAWMVIEGFLKVLPRQPFEHPEHPEPDTRYIRH